MKLLLDLLYYLHENYLANPEVAIRIYIIILQFSYKIKLLHSNQFRYFYITQLFSLYFGYLRSDNIYYLINNFQLD